MTTVVGLVTARGGSKGIPRKNLATVAGKPLIAWTIQAALASTALHRVIVSTDDEEIARVAQQWGAEVPFMRPPELAQDCSPHVDVVRHAAHWLVEHDPAAPEYLMTLQPTSPLRTSVDIAEAIDVARRHQATAVVSVCAARDHPWLCKRILEDGTLGDFVAPSAPYLRRQDLPAAYALNGAIYLNRISSILTDDTLLPPVTYPYVMPEARSLDVDTLWDLQLADLVLRSEHG